VATGSFLGEPQPVEVLHAGTWFAGELLGWRHEEDGACRVRVRCVVGGLRHTAWTDLGALRLPRPPAETPAPSSPALPRHTRAASDTVPHPLLPAPVRPPVPRPRRVRLVEWSSTT
jgi:hypothetical protein